VHLQKCCIYRLPNTYPFLDSQDLSETHSTMRTLSKISTVLGQHQASSHMDVTQHVFHTFLVQDPTRHDPKCNKSVCPTACSERRTL
jgi:hypothetical protein